MAKYRGYIGTYTKADSEGIYTFELDTEKKALSTPKPAAKLGSPTYLNIAKDNEMLYAVVKDGDNGGVAAYRVDGSTGELTSSTSRPGKDHRLAMSASIRITAMFCPPITTTGRSWHTL